LAVFDNTKSDEGDNESFLLVSMWEQWSSVWSPYRDPPASQIALAWLSVLSNLTMPCW